MEKTVQLESYLGKINGLQTSVTIFVIIIALLLLALFVCVLLTGKYKLYGFGQSKKKNLTVEETKKPVSIQAEFQ